MQRLLFPSIVHLRTIRTATLSRLPLHFHPSSTLAVSAMSRQTTLSFTSQSASSPAPVTAPAASSSPLPTSAQPQLARTSSKRKNCIESGLDELCQLFGNGAESDDSATAAAAESTSAAAAPASSVSSASAPSSSPSAPLSRAAIRAVFNSCEHDLQRAIDALADRTGRHTDKHSNFTFSSGSSGSSSVGSDVKKQRVGRLQLVEQRGDLFSCASSVALAHCVSVDLAMGKGIAVAFKTKFGGVADLKSQKKQIGEVAVLKHNGRFVYYLVRSFTRHAASANDITKARYFNKPTYASLESSLRGLRAHMEQNAVKHLAMPRIGCGLDALLWPQVSEIIRRVFSDLDCVITIYTL